MAGIVAGLGLTSIDAPPALAAPMQQLEWQIAIGRLPLNDALVQLARQTGVAIARFSDEGSARIVVGPLSGHFSRDEALRLLLHGTGLTYRFVNDHTVAIMRETNPAAEALGAPQAPAVTPSLADIGTKAAGNVNNKGVQRVNSQSEKPKRRSFWSRFLCLIAVCGTASLQPNHARAQQAAVDPTQSGPQGSASASASPLQLQVVTVTGSRIITSSAASPTPVTSVNLGRLQQLNPGLASAGLATLPSLQSTPSQDLAGNGNGPQATFDVRGLGVDRNLILFDGFRVADTTTGATRRWIRTSSRRCWYSGSKSSPAALRPSTAPMQ